LKPVKNNKLNLIPVATLKAPQYRIGLVANRAHQDSSESALVQLLKGSQASIENVLKPHFSVVGRTMDSIKIYDLLAGYPDIERLPYGHDGGLMRLVSRVVDIDSHKSLSAIIYLMDPVDPSSTFPEALALKRQCVIHGKPFLSTLAGAREWIELEAMHLTGNKTQALDHYFEYEKQGIALIAHDAMKPEMLKLVEKHFALLDRFKVRYATGTTGGLLNELAIKIKGHAEGARWVNPCLSGPMGGDAQIAELVLDRTCGRILFLEDPHVARQHEADIQLLERAARVVTDFASCKSDKQCADRWLDLLAQRA
jgi:methylglyoxal synthase